MLTSLHRAAEEFENLNLLSLQPPASSTSHQNTSIHIYTSHLYSPLPLPPPTRKVLSITSRKEIQVFISSSYYYCALRKQFLEQMKGPGRVFGAGNGLVDMLLLYNNFFSLYCFSSFPYHSHSFFTWWPRGCTNCLGPKYSLLVYWTALLCQQACT